VVPELPEVENIALGLRETIVGKRVERVRVRTPVIIRGPHRRRWRQFLRELGGRRVERVPRRGKRLILAAEAGSALVFQLGMTGKFLLWGPRSGITAATPKHTRLTVSFRDGTRLLFVDTRRFGRMWFLSDLDPDRPDDGMEAAGLTRLGPEALRTSPTTFAAILKTARPVKSLLLDQGRIAGLGNIYVDESLWAAGVHPARAGNSLTPEEAVALLRQIKNVLRRAIRAGGTTFSDFRNAYGDMGRFRRRLKVYRCQGRPCKRCGTMIERLVLAGRGTHICPRCQVR
jgi:formamidopyrimidine-DNA glycosylase